MKRKGELLPQWAQIQTSELRIELEDSLLLPKPADGVSAAFHAARKLAQRLPFELRNRFVERRTNLRKHDVVELCGEFRRKLERLGLRTRCARSQRVCAHRLRHVLVDFEAALDDVAEQTF